MSEIRFGPNCPLTRYLKEASVFKPMFNRSCLKAELAGALLYGLGYPRFTRKLPDITLTAQLVQEIKKTEQTDLVFEAREKCVHCPQLDSCEVGALFKDG